MNTLHHMASMFLAIQFVVVLLGLIAATRLADPQISWRGRKAPAGVDMPPLTNSDR